MAKPSWQSQSYKKGASVGVKKFADGGEVSSDAQEDRFKEEGLAASNADRARRDEGKSDWEKFKQGWKDLGSRFTQGNIDQPGSKAYNEHGAGRGKWEASKDKYNDDMWPAVEKAADPEKPAAAAKGDLMSEKEPGWTSSEPKAAPPKSTPTPSGAKKPQTSKPSAGGQAFADDVRARRAKGKTPTLPAAAGAGQSPFLATGDRAPAASRPAPRAPAPAAPRSPVQMSDIFAAADGGMAKKKR
jgi:hypothetical protein